MRARGAIVRYDPANVRIARGRHGDGEARRQRRQQAVDAWDPEHAVALRAAQRARPARARSSAAALGQCGSCTVLVDDAPVRSCTVRLHDVAGHRVVTARGARHARAAASGAGGVHRRAGGAVRLLHQRHGDDARWRCCAGSPRPTREQAQQALAGNLCRCGSHDRVLRAVQRAADAHEGMTMAQRESSLSPPCRDADAARDLLEAGALVVGWVRLRGAPQTPARGHAAARSPSRAACRSTPSIPSSPFATTARWSSVRARSTSAPAIASRCGRWSARSSTSSQVDAHRADRGRHRADAEPGPDRRKHRRHARRRAAAPGGGDRARGAARHGGRAAAGAGGRARRWPTAQFARPGAAASPSPRCSASAAST